MTTAFQSNAFQNNSFQIDDAVIATVARGGATYLTREEMAELARRQRVIDKKQREDDRALEATIRETYDDIVRPEIKIARNRAMQETDDEEALITMVLHHFRTRH